MISAIISAILAIFLSDVPAKLISEKLFLSAIMPELIKTTFPSLDKLLAALIDCLLSPVMFVVFLLIIRPIVHLFAMLITTVARKRSKKNPGHLGKYKTPLTRDNPNYAKADAPWYIRHDKTAGGITRGICGFLALLMVTSPIVGLISSISGSYNYALKQDSIWRTFGISKKTVGRFSPIFNDCAIATLGATGGKLIFDGVSTSVLLEDRNVTFDSELRSCVELLGDVFEVFEIISGTNQITEEQKKTIAEIEEKINASDTTRLIATDVLTGMCRSWLNNEAYMGIQRPGNMPGSFDTMINSILKTCAISTTECVGRDIGTLLNIYVIFRESDLNGTIPENELANKLEAGELLDKIYQEMAKNPCMSYSSEMMLDSTLILMAKSIDLANLSDEDRLALLGYMTESLNKLNNDNTLTFETKVEQMTKVTIEAAEQYGIELPDGVSEMAVTSMLNQLVDQTEYTPEELDRFLTYYSSSVSGALGNGGSEGDIPLPDDKEIEDFVNGVLPGVESGGGLTQEQQDEINDFVEGIR